MKLVWNRTGDSLDLDPTNQEFAAYWIDCLDQCNINAFKLQHSAFDSQWLAELEIHLRTIDRFLQTKLGIDALAKFYHQDLLDQQVLNAIHRNWIDLIQTHPRLVQLLSKNQNLFDHWNQINKKVHAIEENFVSKYLAKKYWEVPNPFGSDILNFNLGQIKIIFSQEGRSTFNKWKLFDYNLTDNDTNDFLCVGSEITISLHTPLSYEPPKEYLRFCKANNIDPVGDYLNLANFSNFENDLTRLRHVFVKNINCENNTVSFQI